MNSLASAADTCIPGLPCLPVNQEPVRTADPANPSCSAEFLTQMKSRAFLEAQREQVISGINIRKPDSVLEYTCFDQIVGMNAQRVALLFSGSALTEAPLGSAILTSLKNYQSANFAHEFLGGFADTFDTAFSGQASNSSYNCDAMNTIYNFAKCSDFAVDAPFLSFETLASFDPRALPNPCSGGTPLSTGQIAQATAFTPDVLQTQIAFSGAGACNIPPIRTGVMVTKKRFDFKLLGVRIVNQTEHEEGICPPGCVLSQNGSKCEAF